MVTDPQPRLTSARAPWREHPERGSAPLLRLMTALSVRVGRRVSRLVLYPIAAYYFVFAPRARRCMRDYLGRALGRRPRARDRWRLILSFATTIHDRVLLLAGREQDFQIRVDGVAAIREALAEGGLFLMGAHVGSFEVLRLIGRRKTPSPVAMAMYEDNARKLNTIVAAVSAHEPPEIIAVGRVDSMLRIQAALDRGKLVGMLADRRVGTEPTLPVPFLGTPAHFPLGPLRLAATLRRRVLFMLGLYEGGSRYRVVFEPLADFRDLPASARAAAVEAAVHRYVALLDRYCRAQPYNWFNFYDFWDGAV